jgi:L-ascorbate metabolism protein UlaG (beta-lactamase superfamily)
MFGPSPAPHPLLGTSRFPTEPFFNPADLPEIDVVVYSHDHYDHLDYKTVRQIKDKIRQFWVPLGIGAHLERWKVDKNKVQEFTWWDDIQLGKVKFTFAPARHFSGRGIIDRFSTLWGSWIIQSDSTSIYFSGDSGYGPHFKEIGQRFGPFDLALMECGQYDPRWQEIHMLPEETVHAALDLKAKKMQPIHWGQFSLSIHEWNAPPIEVLIEAQKVEIPIQIPKIGEEVYLSKSINTESWWDGN